MSPRVKNVLAQSFHLWLGHKFPFLVPVTKVEDKGGWAVRQMLVLAVLWMTASKAVSLHFIWNLHPSITNLKGLVFNQALSHLLDTEKLLSFLAKNTAICVFIDIDHLQRPRLLSAVKVTTSAHPFCSLENHRPCG